MTQMPFSPSPEGACPQVPDPATAGSFFNSTSLMLCLAQGCDVDAQGNSGKRL